MKTIIGSIGLRLRRGLCIFLLGIAALWAMPGRVHAQVLYVTSANGTTNTIGEYDATTGAPINSNMIVGGSLVTGLALSGNNLFALINGLGTVAEYNATTGAVVNATFVPELGGYPYALALSGNYLYVGSIYGGGTVNKYDATTGALINGASLVTGIYNLNVMAVANNVIFVGTDGGSATTINTYDATTGAALNVIYSGGVSGIAVSGNNLFASIRGGGGGTIVEYNATTGALINGAFITGLTSPGAIAVSGNNLFVLSETNDSLGDSGWVGEYDATTGALINAQFITGFSGYPLALAIGPGAGNNVPLANAGPNQTIQGGTLVTLDGSGSSDPSGQLPSWVCT